MKQQKVLTYHLPKFDINRLQFILVKLLYIFFDRFKLRTINEDNTVNLIIDYKGDFKNKDLYDLFDRVEVVENKNSMEIDLGFYKTSFKLKKDFYSCMFSLIIIDGNLDFWVDWLDSEDMDHLTNPDGIDEKDVYSIFKFNKDLKLYNI